ELVWRTDQLIPAGDGLEVSPDGKRVAPLSAAVVLLDAETGKELTSRKDQTWDATSARFSPDSKILAVTTLAGTVVLRDAATGAVLPQSPDLMGAVFGLSFSSDGKKLSACAGNTWVRWDLTAEKPRAEPLAQFVYLSPDARVGIRPDTY